MVLAAGTLILLGAAIWNRFPLTFWDTRAYLIHSLTLQPRPDRVIGYSLFIRLWHWTGTVWAVVIAQAAILLWQLWLTAQVVLRRPSQPRFLGALLLLTLLTALPWIAGQLMPDLFTPILVLALFLLLAGWNRVTWRSRVVLGAVIVVAATVHVTHAAFGIGLVLVLAGLDWLSGIPIRLALRPVLAIVAALVLGALAMLGFNYSRTHRAELVSGGNAFLLGHLVESGLASELLDEHCGVRDYALCPWRQSLPITTDEFLWQDRLPFHPFERINETRRESHRLLLDSWREHPLSQLRVAVEYSLGTLDRFGTGEGLDSLALPGLDSALSLVFPGDRRSLDRARQQHDEIPVEALRSMQTPVGWLFMVAALAVVIVGWLRRWRQDMAVRFLVAALVAILLYAVLCGNTSGIYDRYESRLVWLTGFGLWLAVERRYRFLRSEQGRVSATR